MRRGRKSHTQPFTGYKATVVADTEDGVILATDVRAGNVADRIARLVQLGIRQAKYRGMAKVSFQVALAATAANLFRAAACRVSGPCTG